MLDKVFLEDQKQAFYASPDNNTSSENGDETKKNSFTDINLRVSLSSAKKQSNSKKEILTKETNVSLTVKRFFKEDSDNVFITNESDSFQEKRTTKRIKTNEYNKSKESFKNNQFKDKFNYFEKKFKEKANYDKKSFFTNIFSGFLRKQTKENKEISNNENYNQIMEGDLEEEDDTDGIQDKSKPPLERKKNKKRILTKKNLKKKISINWSNISQIYPKSRIWKKIF